MSAAINACNSDTSERHDRVFVRSRQNNAGSYHVWCFNASTASVKPCIPYPSEMSAFSPGKPCHQLEGVGA